MTAVQIAVSGEGNRVSCQASGAAARIEVFSERGMGGAEVKFPVEEWPPAITLRLHLAGLESLRFRFAGHTVAVSVSSSKEHIVTESLSRAGEAGATPLDDDNPYWMPVTRTPDVGANLTKIPARGRVRPHGGAPQPASSAALRFDVSAPAALFTEAGQPFAFDWLDFYR